MFLLPECLSTRSVNQCRLASGLRVVAAALILVGSLLGASMLLSCSKPPLQDVSSEPHASVVHEWTAEYIVKNPAGYLAWLMAKLAAMEERCRDRVRHRQAKIIAIDKERDNRMAAKALAEEELKGLNEVYENAVASGRWPALVHTQYRYHRLARDELMREIAACDAQITGLSSMMEMDVNARAHAERDIDAVNVALAMLAAYKTRLMTQMRTVEEENRTENLHSVLELLDTLAYAGNEADAILASCSSILDTVDSDGSSSNATEQRRHVARRKQVIEDKGI